MSDAAARRPTLRGIAETIAATVAGAGLAGAAWSVLDLTVVAAVVGGLNGALSGARRIYRWRSFTGWLAFALDSTWALVTTAAALVAHLVAALQRTPRNHVGVLSERQDRHVYERGYTVRRGFMLTVGNVVNGAGHNADRDPRRQDTVRRHEHVHVWQARWFGPVFPIVYGLWWEVATIVAVAIWAIRRPPARFGRIVDALGYYRNPFEWWAYSREGRWPPPQALARWVWRRPMTSALTQTPWRR